MSKKNRKHKKNNIEKTEKLQQDIKVKNKLITKDRVTNLGNKFLLGLKDYFTNFVSYKWIWATLICATIILAFFLLSQNNHNNSDYLWTNIAQGEADTCKAFPEFARTLGYGNNSVIGNRDKYKGLVLYNNDASGNELKEGDAKIFQDETWKVTGNIFGPPTRDKRGNIYVGTVPYVNLYDNPPEKSNIIYKVDSKTGKMLEYFKLPVSIVNVAKSNAYGTLAMTYDCDTDSLFIATLANSTQEHELGKIFQFSIKESKIISQIDNVDAIGLKILNQGQTKKLLIGSTRVSKIFSAKISNKGVLENRVVEELDITNKGGNGDDKIRKFIINSQTMQIDAKGVAFDYNLVESDEVAENDYYVKINPDKLVLLESVNNNREKEGE